MKTLLAILVLCASVSAQTLELSSDEVQPGEPFTLTLTGPDALGASWYLKATAEFDILARESSFPDPTVADAQLGSISEMRSVDLGGTVDDFTRPVPGLIELTLEAPQSLGTYYLSTDAASVWLLSDFTSQSIPAQSVAVHVVPEASPWLALSLFGLIRYRYDPRPSRNSP